MAHAIFYTHQTSGAHASVCTCDNTHQMEKTALEALKKPLKYANESPPPNENVDMVIDESTPLLPHEEIEESNLSALHEQISSYHTELNNSNEESEKSRETC